MPVRASRRFEPNPYHNSDARAHSCYAGWHENALVRVHDPDSPLPPIAELIHAPFRAMVLNPRFPCLGAKVAIRNGAYRMGIYHELAAPDVTAGLARDLFTFVQEQATLNTLFSTFVASFINPVITSEQHFEELLWAQLQRLHDLDAVHHPWDPSVSSDPHDPHFSFSFASVAFFVVGMHPASSRWARRFAWPTLVFNAHAQFVQLKQRGAFVRMQEVIRGRDSQLQGSPNPMLGNFGEYSEAREYSGRAVEEGWHCPFQTRDAEH